ncbi:MAG: aldehyde dehydrogenase family protein [Bryobacteraceae bacterium]|nr:aldehyde dehydrogenase family protein [Bryobacteraceae bacterium]MDW8377788.1 aldehyde dehydrogenase family protein [Bryobacterales bacterium]
MLETTPSPQSEASPQPQAAEILARLGIEPVNSGAHGVDWIAQPGGELLDSINPATGASLAAVRLAMEEDYDEVTYQTAKLFEKWRMFPAPKRGLIVREIGDELRKAKEDLGALVSLEAGKILAEGRGEVQEMIDIADFAVGLSRQLYGLTMHSERPAHRMYEQWHPLGMVGVITAFNFPVAVWAWNAMIAAVCGNTVLWKPSLKTPLTAIAVQHLVNRVLDRHGWRGVFSLIIGTDSQVSQRLLEDRRIPLVSATGSCQMGQHVAQWVGARFGRTILELGGNNGVIIMPDADLELALRAVLFGAVGTAGQRCTTIRRLFLHRSIAETFTKRLIEAYRQVRIGDPLNPSTLMGPLIDERAVTRMMQALALIESGGGEILYGGKRLDRPGYFVEPAIVRAHPQMKILREEIFAPILYVLEFDTLDEAIEWHNNVPQGLSSAIFTRDLIAAETFLSHRGSDCGIANVNLGTSGAEIGGAFGGEKDTGGGREAGSDSWKAYMRRQTVTINWSSELPLAQGIRFEL